MSTGTATISPSFPTARRRVWNVFLWVLQIAVAGMFLGAAYGKLTADPAMVAAFEEIGFGQWLRVLTGSLELLGALLIVIPAVSGAGGLLLGIVMVGAILTHLFLVGGSSLAALILLLAVAPVAWTRPAGVQAVLRLINR